MNVEKLQEIAKDVNSNITAFQTEMKGVIAKQNQEIRQYGEARAETVAKMQELDTQFLQMQSDMKGVKEGLDELVVDNNRKKSLGVGGGIANAIQSFGQAFVTSDVYEGAKSNDPKKFSAIAPLHRKDIISDHYEGSTISLIPHFQGRETTIEPEAPKILNLLNTVSTGDADTIKWVENFGSFEFKPKAIEAAALNATAVKVSAQDIHHIKVNEIFFIKEKPYKVTGRNQAAGTFSIDPPLQDAIAVGDELIASFVGMTPRGEFKPELSFYFTTRQGMLKTLAALVTMTQQTFDHSSRVRNTINNKLIPQLRRNLERHILNGDGSDNALQGILTNPRVGTLDINTSSGTATADTIPDVIRRAITKVGRSTFMSPDAIVTHPEVVEAIELMKDTTGHYLWSDAGDRLWRLPIITSWAMEEDRAIIAPFKDAMTLYERDNFSLVFSNEDGDNFRKNLVTGRAEADFFLAVEYPEAVVNINLKKS